jgi:hypothetical protein
MPDYATTCLLVSPARSAAFFQMPIAFGTSIPWFSAHEAGGGRIGFRHFPIVQKVPEHSLDFALEGTKDGTVSRQARIPVAAAKIGRAVNLAPR